MHRMIWRLVSGRCGPSDRSSGAFVLIHRSGTAVQDGGGAPLVFPSPASAEEFRLRYMCEPPAYRCTEASELVLAA